MKPLILASASPRRKALLAQILAEFEVQAADIDETPNADEHPGEYVLRMAREKAQAIQAQRVLASDTAVVSGGLILGKPADEDAARAMLTRLSDGWHSVFSAVYLRCDGVSFQDIAETRVKFAPLSEAQISAYLATDEPWDKAGGYAIQGLAGVFVERIEGSYSNVVGLPLAQTNSLLNAAGIATRLSGGTA
ncbi:MAG: septum formation inhibitor Maf [Gammaproteobacteria bacterium]|nr:MAG: septum formation inhibitor Maf [Gammaproteobacteria bacterium]